MFAISAGHEKTAEAAEVILHAGGNAFDAAIAAFFASCVAEPCMTGAGGGAFANIFTAEGKAYLFDFFCQTPKTKKQSVPLDFYPMEVNFGTMSEVFHIGKGSTATPGNVAGMFALHEKLSSLPMRELVQPAIELAKNGLKINRFQHFDFQLLESILGVDKQAEPIFFKGKKLKNIGDTMQMPQFADFLEVLWREGKDFFYRGEIAQKITADYAQSGGFLTMADFENYTVQIRQPLRFTYREKTILTNPFPSIGGANLTLFLKFLEQKELPENPFSKEHALTLLNVFQELEKAKKSAKGLGGTLAELLHNNAFFKLKNKTAKRGATTHFNIVDKEGNAISLTSSLGEGCGYFVEGTDIQLNNMMGEAALLPNGFHSWQADSRLSSMMSPTLLLDENDEIEVVTGSGGAGRIPAAIAQVLSYLVDYKMDLQQAVNGARVHFDHEVFHLGKGFFQDFGEKELLFETKRWQEKSLFFGGAHTIQMKNDALISVGDERRDGVAIT